MIRINLLGVERRKIRKVRTFDPGRRVSLACSLILVAGVAGTGWWYFSLIEASNTVDAELVAAQEEVGRLRSIIAEVVQFEARRGQLQQRVALIEQLRNGQSRPVQLLDHVSRSLPDMLWLTDLEQEGNEVTIQGRSTTLIALSDFVGNLGSNPLLQKPIEIVDSQVDSETNPQQGQAKVELIRFTVKAQLAAVPAPARGGGAGGTVPAATAPTAPAGAAAAGGTPGQG
jgi:type IV pilus assembly protein PilN